MVVRMAPAATASCVGAVGSALAGWAGAAAVGAGEGSGAVLGCVASPSLTVSLGAGVTVCSGGVAGFESSGDALCGSVAAGLAGSAATAVGLGAAASGVGCGAGG